MDFKTAFLNGELKEDIFMGQPEGFVQGGDEELVCHLRKSFYGLKQSPRCWFKRLKDYFLGLGFKQNLADPCVFLMWKGDQLTIVMCYVNDLIQMADAIEDIENLKRELSDMFHMTDLGQMNFCLGITGLQDEDLSVAPAPICEGTV